MASLHAVNAAANQVLSTRPAVDVPEVVTLISLVAYCRYAGIRPPSATRDNQSPPPWFYSARPTKRGLASFIVILGWIPWISLIKIVSSDSTWIIYKIVKLWKS